MPSCCEAGTEFAPSSLFYASRFSPLLPGRNPSTSYRIDTFAGGGVGDGGPAVQAHFYVGHDGFLLVATDAAGNVYVTDSENHRVRRIDTAGVISTYAGTGQRGFSGDGGPAVQAALYYPSGVAADGAGNLYVTDPGNNRIRKVDSTGAITTIAGSGEEGFSGDGGPAVQAALSYPAGVAVDGAGNVYVTGYESNRVRRIDTAGVISTFAGSGEEGFSGDGGPAVLAQLNIGHDGFLFVATDGAANLYIADSGNNRIRKVDATGTITTIAGMGEEGFSGDGGPAVQAALSYPAGMAVDGSGNVYIADAGNHRVRRIDTAGVISTFAGSGEEGFSGDGGPAVQAALSYPVSVAVDGSGNLYVAGSESNRVRRIDTAGVISTFAGSEEEGFTGDGGPAVQAHLYSPAGVAVDGSGNVYIADTDNTRIRKVDSTGTITTIAGTGQSGFSGDGGPAIQAALSYPAGVAADGAGNLYIADTGNYRIRKVDATGVITPVAGTGDYGDGGTAVQRSRLLCSAPLAWRWTGRAISTSPIPATIAFAESMPRGRSPPSPARESTASAGTSGPAVQAALDYPRGVAVDGAGNLFIADSGNNRIRRVDAHGDDYHHRRHGRVQLQRGQRSGGPGCFGLPPWRGGGRGGQSVHRRYCQRQDPQGGLRGGHHHRGGHGRLRGRRSGSPGSIERPPWRCSGRRGQYLHRRYRQLPRSQADAGRRPRNLRRRD